MLPIPGGPRYNAYMPDSRLIISRTDGVTVVDFSNAPVLDVMTVMAIEKDLYALVDEQQRDKVVLDLSAVRFLASQMLGTLVALHKKASNIKGKVIVCGLTPNLLKVFRMSRLDAVLRLADRVEDGIAALTGSGAAAPSAGEHGAETESHGGIRRAIRKQIRILFAGALVIVPLAITAWVIWSLGSWLDAMGREAFAYFNSDFELPKGIGALILVGVIYLIGLLTHLWIFQGAFALLERLVTHLPGAKTIYESVRDLMKLFGGEQRQMGRVIQYNVPDSDMSFMGILTNENPLGLPRNDPSRKVAVFLPLSYMIGGPTLLVSPEHIVEVDMSVEQCMKLCATAQVGSRPIVDSLPADPDGENAAGKDAK